MEKLVLRVMGQDEKDACDTEHLAGGVEVGFEIRMHAMRLLWAQDSQKEYGRFLLIDVHNVFNEDNWRAMLWDICHKWTSCTQFTFNYYCHWATRLVQDLEGSHHFLNRKKGVTQGYPLVMMHRA